MSGPIVQASAETATGADGAQRDLAAAQAGAGSHPWLVAWLLMAVFTLNILDRQVVNVLGNEIGRDLKLTDGQLGLLGGIAFSAVYFMFGFPWGWLADRPRVSRVRVISSALAIWSGMTVLCGMAPGYAQLLLARMGVAAGEAGCAPAAQSLIAESVPREKLARALAIFGLGIPIGAFLGKSLGGLLTDAYGWRSAFIIVGGPGLLLAMILLLVLKDPRKARARALAGSGAQPSASSLRQACAEILRSRTIIYITLGATIMGSLVAGGSFWGMMHFQRNLGLSPGEAGVLLGVQGGLTGLVGTLLGGWIADRWAAKRARHYLTPGVVGMVLTPPLLMLAWWADSWWLALAFMTFPTMFDNVSYGGTNAATQRLLSPNVRGSAGAVIAMFGTLVGMGLGVTTFGLASDLVRQHLPSGVPPGESVRYVLMGSAALYLVPAFLFWRASWNVERELAQYGSR